MNQPLMISVPLTPTAFHRLAMNAETEGVSLEAYLARISERGFGVPLDHLMSAVFGDAVSAADRVSVVSAIPITKVAA